MTTKTTVVLDTQKLQCCVAYEPPSARYLHVATRADLDGLSKDQAVKLFNSMVEKADRLKPAEIKALTDEAARDELFKHIDGNLDVFAVEVPVAPGTPAETPADGKRNKQAGSSPRDRKKGQGESAKRAAAETGKKTPGKGGAVGRGRPGAFPPEAKITRLAAENPYRADSTRARAVDLMAKAGTVADFLAKVAADKVEPKIATPFWHLTHAAEAKLVKIG